MGIKQGCSLELRSERGRLLLEDGLENTPLALKFSVYSNTCSLVCALSQSLTHMQHNSFSACSSSAEDLHFSAFTTACAEGLQVFRRVQCSSSILSLKCCLPLKIAYMWSQCVVM